MLPRPARTVAVAVGRPDAAGGDPAAAGRAVLRLHVLVLGEADGRAAVGRPGAAPRPSCADRPTGDRGATGKDEGAPATRPGASRRLRDRRAVGARPPGGGRIVGRDPAALGVVDDHAR